MVGKRRGRRMWTQVFLTPEFPRCKPEALTFCINSYLPAHFPTGSLRQITCLRWHLGADPWQVDALRRCLLTKQREEAGGWRALLRLCSQRRCQLRLGACFHSVHSSRSLCDLGLMSWAPHFSFLIGQMGIEPGGRTAGLQNGYRNEMISHTWRKDIGTGVLARDQRKNVK